MVKHRVNKEGTPLINNPEGGPWHLSVPRGGGGVQINLRKSPPSTPLQAGRSILWGSRAGGLSRAEGLIAAHFVCKPCHLFLPSPRYQIDSARLMRRASQPPHGARSWPEALACGPRDVTAGQSERARSWRRPSTGAGVRAEPRCFPHHLQVRGCLHGSGCVLPAGWEDGLSSLAMLPLLRKSSRH